MTKKKRSWISEHIRKLGKKKKDLAAVLGLPHTRISDIISGNRALKLTEIEPFADFMDMTIDEVLGRFGTSKSKIVPRYDGLIKDEKDFIELYRGLSEPGKQKFQQLAAVMKKAEDE